MARSKGIKWLDDNTIQYTGSVRKNERLDPNNIEFTIDINGMSRKKAIEYAFGGTNFRIKLANWYRDNKTQEELVEMARSGVKLKWDNLPIAAPKEVDVVDTLFRLSKEEYVEKVMMIGVPNEVQAEVMYFKLHPEKVGKE